MLKKDFRDLAVLTKRNTKLYFKDKGAFLPSLITPLILLVLFVTFLKNTYTDTLTNIISTMGVTVGEGVINSFVGSWLMSSVIGVCSVTVAFCVNTVMVNDKVNKTLNDLLITPTKRSVISLSYFFSNAIATMIVNYVCLAIGFIYIAIVGWYFAFTDVLIIILIVFINSLFGCSLACVIEYFVSSNGGLSAIAMLVSSMYGFVCGAFMPLAQFTDGIRNVISCLPGTYGIGLLREYFLRGPLNKMAETLPSVGVEAIKDTFDGNLYFFGDKVSILAMFLIVLGVTLLFIGIYICFCFIKKRSKKDKKKIKG